MNLKDALARVVSAGTAPAAGPFTEDGPKTGGTSAPAPSAAPFNVDVVRTAWRRRVQTMREAAMPAQNTVPMQAYDIAHEKAARELPAPYIEQLWTDHILVSAPGEDEDMGPGHAGRMWSVPYTVAAPGTTAADVTFGEPTTVRQVYVAASAGRALARTDPLGAIMLAAPATEEEMIAMSKPSFIGKGSVQRSGKPTSAGEGDGTSLRVRADPTLPSTSKAIVDKTGKRKGTIKAKGGKFTHSGDNHNQEFASTEAAKRMFAVGAKNSEDTGSDGSDSKGSKGSGKPWEKGSEDSSDSGGTAKASGKTKGLPPEFLRRAKSSSSNK